MQVHLHALHPLSELSEEDNKIGIAEKLNVGLLETFVFLFTYLFHFLVTVAFPSCCTKSIHNSKHVPCGKFWLTR